MPNIREQLQSIVQGRVCLVGVGNVERGDDGFGVRLAEAIGICDFRFAIHEVPIVVAGMSPEKHLTFLTDGAFDTVLFLDAVEFGAAPGSVVLLDASEMASRFPQVSTHRISLGLLAQLLEANRRTKAWLLGVQPASLKTGSELSPCVQRTLHVLLDIFLGALDAREPNESSESQTPHLADLTGNSGPSCVFRLPSSLAC